MRGAPFSRRAGIEKARPASPVRAEVAGCCWKGASTSRGRLRNRPGVMRFGGRIPGHLLRNRYVVRLHRRTAHVRAHEKGPTGSVRLKRGERIVPLVIGRKLSQAQDDERTVPLSKGAKVLQGAAAARRDAPHLVPKTVTGCGLLGAQCTLPSLICKRWGFFTFGAGVESQPLTYDGEVSQGRGAERKVPSLCPENRDSPKRCDLRKRSFSQGAHRRIPEYRYIRQRL